MKKIVLEFCHRGFVACGFGPMVLAIFYLVMQQQAGIQTLSVNQVCLGIFSLSALAFIAGGLNVLYQIERLPLMVAILIHGIVLYIGYLVTYLVNGWLEQGVMPLLVFSAIFILGYFAIWIIIFFITKKRTNCLNEKLKKKQEDQMR